MNSETEKKILPILFLFAVSGSAGSVTREITVTSNQNAIYSFMNQFSQSEHYCPNSLFEK